MLRHGDIWSAIDRLAEAHGLSPSGLARRAGLDPTSFNKSKRSTAQRSRWPGTESLARILEATGTSLGDFVSMIEGEAGPVRVPLIGWADAARAASFDNAGRPAGDRWREIDRLPLDRLPPDRLHSFGVEVDTDELWPVYARGDVIIVSTDAEPRPGDRVFARTRFDDILARRLVGRSASRVELAPLVADDSVREYAAADLLAVQRIAWVGYSRVH